MSLLEESLERQRLYIPTRSASPADPWQPKGQMPDYTPKDRQAMPVRVAVLAVIAALNLLLPSASPALGTVILLVDVAGLIVLFDTLNKLWYAFWRRPPLLRWTRFPAHTGEQLEALLVARPALEVIGPVLAVLRCVRDEVVEGEGRVPMQVYSQTAEFDFPGERLKEVALSFELPSEVPGTELDREDAVYWQIAVRIPVIGPDLELVYLAPVYARDEPTVGGTD
ncbi:MAG TPA: hypothetical protein VNM67_13565 [Thermoanaerobaculia bacterium]|jgi:hypothetical protein|nr:hypothetical protein [Thermoanaerobaculia bacterium]